MQEQPALIQPQVPDARAGRHYLCILGVSSLLWVVLVAVVIHVASCTLLIEALVCSSSTYEHC